MPKVKTHRGAAKRFSLTGKGKVKRSKAYASHILTKKTTKRKRNLRKNTVLHKRDEKGIKRLIPYAG
ncbi:MAG TPA: 50S ribosomal protein L35 [Syntrophales bacterium]|nr:50S ribosomal protein L35 [Syntrophales bacterium]HQB30454.1 50S ribosomal protein L35 [Syntrophales bacterium]HQN76913.1 50S ribosomal protein L35 [Syntrophales bacterium]HQQ26920.1 50S ribosomal protein L35 [Syntrophales bacterium]